MGSSPPRKPGWAPNSTSTGLSHAKFLAPLKPDEAARIELVLRGPLLDFAVHRRRNCNCEGNVEHHSGGDDVTDAWLERPEGGSGVAMRLLVRVALGVGRSVARVVLFPITAYFMTRRGPERRASRAYLTRVLGRAPTWLEVARHFHTFAGVTLDRVYFLGWQLSRFDMRLIGIEKLHHAMDLGRGVLLIGAHVGSFDALRAASTLRPDVTVRVVLDAEHSPALSAILKQLNPQIAAGIINPRKDGTAVALEIGAALNQGALVTMLADRGRPGNATASVAFLGQTCRVPDGTLADCRGAARAHRAVRRPVPWRKPVRSAFRAAHGATADRPQGSVSINCASVVQDFANRLAALLRIAPYNWFNFYDFWNDRPPGNDRLTLAAAPLHAADPDVDTLLARLARPAPDSTSFVEVRYSSLLDKPIVVSGHLEHREDGALVRRVESPYQEVTELRGENVSVERAGSKPRHFSLDRAPELRGMLAIKIRIIEHVQGRRISQRGRAHAQHSDPCAISVPTFFGKLACGRGLKSPGSRRPRPPPDRKAPVQLPKTCRRRHPVVGGIFRKPVSSSMRQPPERRCGPAP